MLHLPKCVSILKAEYVLEGKAALIIHQILKTNEQNKKTGFMAINLGDTQL